MQTGRQTNRQAGMKADIVGRDTRIDKQTWKYTDGKTD